MLCPEAFDDPTACSLMSSGCPSSALAVLPQQPQPSTSSSMRDGAENGKVRARLREDGAMKTVSTDDRPIEEHEMFDPDDVSPTVKFASIALKLLGRIKINRG